MFSLLCWEDAGTVLGQSGELSPSLLRSKGQERCGNSTPGVSLPMQVFFSFLTGQRRPSGSWDSLPRGQGGFKIGKQQCLDWEDVWKAGTRIQTSAVFPGKLDLSGGFDSVSGEAEEDQTGALVSVIRQHLFVPRKGRWALQFPRDPALPPCHQPARGVFSPG